MPNNPSIAVILSGSGYLDGAEIREAVLTLLHLDEADAEISIFAPDINQLEVVNHITGETVNETRNVLLESARIARGEISDIAKLNVGEFDGLVIPGGFGVAKNLSNFASAGSSCEVLPIFAEKIKDFFDAKKPIGAICITPAVISAIFQGKAKLELTVGDKGDVSDIMESMGAKHNECAGDDIIIDSENNIVSCSAYMRDDRLSTINQGIKKLVNEIIIMSSAKMEAA